MSSIKDIEQELDSMVLKYGAVDCDGSKFMDWSIAPSDERDNLIDRWDTLVALYSFMNKEENL